MEADIFACFDVKVLEARLRRQTDQDVDLLADFGRFLAAYYSNSVLVTCTKDGVRLPNLWKLSEENDSGDVLDHRLFTTVSTRFVSENLPSNYGPNLAVELLFLTGNSLEACFFVDHLNDFRSQLILRHLTDLKHGFTLLKSHCVDVLINNVIDHPATYFSANEQTSSRDDALRTVLTALVQCAIMFDMDLINLFAKSAIETIEELINTVPTDADENVAFPRPPIYMIPSYNGTTSFENTIKQKVFVLIKAFCGLLHAANVAQTLINRIMKRIAIDAEDIDQRMFNLDSSTDKGLDFLEELLIRLLVVVLRSNYIDEFIMAKRESREDLSLIKLEDTITHLRELTTKFDASNFVSFVNSGSQFDRLSVTSFLQFLQENALNKQQYLPPLSPDTANVWRTFLLTSHQSSVSANRDNYLHVVPDDQKHLVTDFDLQRLEFLANRLPYVHLPDPSLIGITIQLQPRNICRPEATKIMAEGSPDEVTLTRPHTERVYRTPPQNPIDESQSLRQRIHSSLRRLGGQSLLRSQSTRSLLTNFNDREMEQEIVDERNFINSLRFNPEAMRAYKKKILAKEVWSGRREKSERISTTSCRGLTSPIPIRKLAVSMHQIHKSEASQIPENISDELKAISSRLSHLKAKWDKPFEDIIRPTETTPNLAKDDQSSGVSSSSMSPTWFERPKRKLRRRRKKPIPADEPIDPEILSNLQVQITNRVESSDDDSAIKSSAKSQDDWNPSGLGTSKSPEYAAEEHGQFKDEDQLEAQHVVQYFSDGRRENVIPEPQTPVMIGRLDLDQLSDRQEPKPKSEWKWSELKVYDRNSTRSNSEVRQKSAKAESSHRTQSGTVFPDWLKLIPYEQSSSRLLKLELPRSKSHRSMTTRSGRKKAHSPYLDLEEVVRDSGFLDNASSQSLLTKRKLLFPSKTIDEEASGFAREPVFTMDMPQHEIDDLIRMAQNNQ